MLVVGLTGGVATGKSNVRRHFSMLGAPAIDADRIVAKLYRNEKIRAKITREFGTASKPKIAEIIFSSRVKRKKLESILHSPTLKEIRKLLQQHRKKKTKIVVVEVPLLFEANLQKRFHKIIVVKVPKKTQLRRLMKKGFSRVAALKRINALMPLRRKLKHADYVIDTSGTKPQTLAKTRKVYNKLLNEL